jgi:HEAT repeat protein
LPTALTPQAPVALALSQAGKRLLTALIDRAQEHFEQTDDPAFIAIEHWGRDLLGTNLQALFMAASEQFTRQLPAYGRWLEALALLAEHGGEHTDTFFDALWQTYFFRMGEASDWLWKHYPDLQRRVSIATDRELPRTWGEWAVAVQSYMSLAESFISATCPSFAYLIGSEDAFDILRDLLADRPEPAPPQGSTLVVGARFDATPTLAAYLMACVGQAGQIDSRGPAPSGTPRVPLVDVFTPLRVVPLADLRKPGGFIRSQIATFSLEQSPYHDMPGVQELEHHPGIPAQEILLHDEPVLLLGESGSGKSALLKHIATDHARKLLEEQHTSIQSEPQIDGTVKVTLAYPLPVYVDLSEFVSERLPDENLDTYVKRTASDMSTDQAISLVLTGLLESGQCVILLDGLDQAATDEQRRMLVENVATACERWHTAGNQIVVSSRPAGYSAAPLPSSFSGYVMRPLDRAQIGPYVLRWMLALTRMRQPFLREEEALQQAQSETLMLVREVSANPALLRLAGNPLILRMLVSIFRTGTIIRPQRVAVYQMLADALLHEWAQANQTANWRQSGDRKPSSDLPTLAEQDIITLLSHLGFWLHSARPAGLCSKSELEAILSNTWQTAHPESTPEQASSLIKGFVSGLGTTGSLLVQVGADHYGFVYPALQEYFAARYLVSSYRLAAGRLRALLHNPRWEEVIALAISFTYLRSQEDASELIETAVLARTERAAQMGHSSGPFEDLLQRDLFFAAQMLAMGIEARPDITAGIVKELTGLWINGDRDSPGRFALVADMARRRLAGLDGTAAGRRALNLMIEESGSSNEYRQSFAVDGLTLWPVTLSEGRSALLGIKKDAPRLVRRAAARALGRMSPLPVEGYQRLLNFLLDSDEEVSEAARHSLRHLPPVPGDALNMFVEMLRSGNLTKLRISLRQLQQIGSLPPMVVNDLLKLLKHPEAEISQAAMNTLGSVTSLPENAMTTICRLAMDAESGMRAQAIAALRRDEELPPEVINYLVDWSYDPDANIRRMALQALGMCKNACEEVLEALMERLDPIGEPVDSIRSEALEPLAIKGAELTKARHTLSDSARDPSLQVRRGLAKALRHFPRPDLGLRQALKALLSDKEMLVREAAADTLAQIEEPGQELIDLLVSMTAMQDTGIAGKAVRALAHQRRLPHTALEALVKALPTHWEEYGEVINGCLQAHHPLGMDLINQIMDLAVLRAVGRIPASGSPDKLRALALEVLGHTLDEAPDIAQVLLDASAENSAPEVQEASLRGLALSRALWVEVQQALLGLIKQGDARVRCAAAIALGTLIRNIPDPPLTSEQMLAAAELVAGLMREMPPRAVWENDTRRQNELHLALSWIVARARPNSPRLSARLDLEYSESQLDQ